MSPRRFPPVRVELVDWDHPASESLRTAQRAEISERYGRDDSEPGPAPTAADITAFFVAFGDDGDAIGCGGLRLLNAVEAEVKRMYVVPSHRGSGTAALVLQRLEQHGRANGLQQLVLETGTLQPDAVRFYTKQGYKEIPKFGHYVDSSDSLCFAKALA